MSTSTVQFAPPFCGGETVKKKADCAHYAKITAFAVGIILLIAGVLALSGAFGNLGGEIGWTLAGLGTLGLAISCVRLVKNTSPAGTHQDTPLLRKTMRATQDDPLPNWEDDPLPAFGSYPPPYWQGIFSSQTDYLNPPSVRDAKKSHSSSKRKNKKPSNSRSKTASRSQSTGFTYSVTPPSDKKSAIPWVKSDPKNYQRLSYGLRDDEDVLVAALQGCEDPRQAKEIIESAPYNAKKSKKVGLALLQVDPSQFKNLPYNARNDEDTVVAALRGCKTSKQAKKVISNASYNAKKSKKVGLALLQVDPSQFENLSYDAKNDEDIVIAALQGCKTSKQAKKVINSAYYDAKNSKKVGLALVQIAPHLLGLLGYKPKNDLEVVRLAIELSTERTIAKIWLSIGISAALNEELRAEVKKRYPNFFEDRTFESNFHNFFHQRAFPDYSSFNTQNATSQTPHAATPPIWIEPDDLKDNTSRGANLARKILKQNHSLDIDLTKAEVSTIIARRILCHLLELDVSISDTDLKKAYQKTALSIHPDKLPLQSGEEAFKALTAAYKQAGF